MVSNRTLTVRLTKDQHDRLKEVAKNRGYLQIAPYIRGIILKEAKSLEG